MILIDTSVWIEFFRAKGSILFKSRVADLINLNEAAYTCPVRFELFLGAKPNEYLDLTTGLGFAERIVTSPKHWDLAANFGFQLRRLGHTVPMSDILIATVAYAEKIPLLTNDQHFATIQTTVISKLTLI